MHTTTHFCGFLNQDNLFSIFPFAATHSFAWAKYILYPIKSMKMCLSLFKGTVGLVTLKKKLLEKSLNLANNPVEDTLVSVFLLQIHATADKIALMNYTALLHLDHWSISKVLPLIRWLPKSSFVKTETCLSGFSTSLYCELPQGMLVVTPAWESQEATPALVLPMTCWDGKLLPQPPTAPKRPRATLSPRLSGFTHDSVFQFPQSNNTDNAGYLNFIKQKHNS